MRRQMLYGARRVSLLYVTFCVEALQVAVGFGRGERWGGWRGGTANAAGLSGIAVFCGKAGLSE